MYNFTQAGYLKYYFWRKWPLSQKVLALLFHVDTDSCVCDCQVWSSQLAKGKWPKDRNQNTDKAVDSDNSPLRRYSPPKIIPGAITIRHVWLKSIHFEQIYMQTLHSINITLVWRLSGSHQQLLLFGFAFDSTSARTAQAKRTLRLESQRTWHLTPLS